MDISDLIKSLAAPEAYPYAVEAIEVHQTHISVVFVAGSWVYKIKKPVNPGFLDFSTLEKRLHFCHEEVRLNRRLAPHIYLGVVPVARTHAGLQFEGDGEVIEWAVKMRRLPDESTLLEMLRRDAVDMKLIRSLARRIASFHCESGANERMAEFGRLHAVAALIRDVLVRAEPMIETTVKKDVFDRVKALFAQKLDQLQAVMESRAARCVPRDCHGDMHLDHIYFFPDRQPPDDLVIIDCIEFSERIRCSDPVADMAFPTMDLAFHGRRDLARDFADAYFTAAQDDEGRSLLPLYTAYRAAIRGMVEGLEAAEVEVPDAERNAARERAQAHWGLALTELEEPNRKPCLALVIGLPGTGKSRLARELGERAGFHVVRADVVRKELAGLPVETRTSESRRESLYSMEWNERTYSECQRRTEELLSHGRRVIVDANFREERQRAQFLECAVRWGVPTCILICEARPETIRRRLETRQGDASDADWSVYQRVAASWEPLSGASSRFCRTLNAEESPEQLFEATMESLRLWNLVETR